MKCISASIVILAGMTTLSASVMAMSHGDSQFFYGAVGAGVAVVGFVQWFRFLNEPGGHS